MTEQLTVGLYPEPGLYRFRFGRACPWVPARVDLSIARDPESMEPMDRAPRLRALVAGEEEDVWAIWPLHPIDRATYESLLSSMPDNPRMPADLGDPPFEVTNWAMLEVAPLLPYIDRQALTWAIEGWLRDVKPKQRVLHGVRFNVLESLNGE